MALGSTGLKAFGRRQSSPSRSASCHRLLFANAAVVLRHVGRRSASRRSVLQSCRSALWMAARVRTRERTHAGLGRWAGRAVWASGARGRVEAGSAGVDGVMGEVGVKGWKESTTRAVLRGLHTKMGLQLQQ
eukprot:350730-Chlamydomonas_euryale.AAC.2